MSTVKLKKRIAEENQLLAEKKWIMEALAKVKRQRNCLQIERLHLEAMKSQLKLKKSSQENKEVATEPPIENQVSDMDLDFLDINEDCNNEQLNLDINTAFNNIDSVYDMEEDEDDEISGDDLLIDMNMFMNGTQR